MERMLTEKKVVLTRDISDKEFDCLGEAYTEVYGISVFPFPTYIEEYYSNYGK